LARKEAEYEDLRADMAVLAVAAADFIGRGNKANPD
jgi:hypothetical protein